MTTRAALVERFAANLKRNGFTVHYRVVPELDGATVSEALYGLADPGGVVIAASPAEPRTRSLLPDVHVSVVSEDRVLPGLAALLEAVRGELPSSLAIVSGPSRSADIEQVLALGVHGPREEHVVIMPPRESAPPGA
ncbi:MAG: LUD domain-containing protein [Thermoleophilia bacterium]|nr:LUD domain-containing protein [Thermoleophilia bacterium]